MTADDFRSLLGDATAGATIGAEQVGPLIGRPLCVVELDRGPDIGPTTSFLPCVVVGVWTGGTPLPEPAGVDILLTDRPAAAAPWVSCTDLPAVLAGLDAACRSSPQAATALAELLRFSPTLSVADALVAESFVYSMLQSGPEHRAWLARRPSRTPVEAASSSGEDGARLDGVAVAVDRQGDVLVITLNRPRVHNAYNSAMRDGLVSALQVAALDPTIARVRLEGAGPSFCSGGDLEEFGSAPDPATAHAVRVARGAAIWMERCSARTEVRIQGSCIGAGVELAAFAHRVAADPTTVVRLPEVSMGLVPGAGGTVSLPRRIGRQRTAYLAISALELDAPTAASWGLVDRVADAPHGPAS